MSRFLFFCLIFGLLTAKEPVKWVVLYDYKGDTPVAEFDPYELVLLDPENHPSIKALKKKGKTVLGYISFGEVEEYRPYFDEVKAEGILSEENENWPGSYFVDMRSPLWRDRLINKLIPFVLNQGFDGIIFDTVDNAEAMEESDPVKYKGMVDGAAELIRAVRKSFPTIPIMINRGYAVVPHVADVITMIMGEDMMTSYNFKKKKYYLLSDSKVKKNIETIDAALKINPDLLIVTLDYWDPADTEQVKKIYDRMREEGYSPYVSTIKLNKIIPEPQ